MIYGIGIDIVEVERIAASIKEFGDRFLQRIFTESERAYCQEHHQPAAYFAARFAAKEAIAKALGTGIGKDVSWLDLEIRRAASGEPSVYVSGNAAIFCQKNGISEIKISLTHARDYAAANAIALLAPSRDQ
jgi:holo-[acyl-carrier protein] synthase